MSSHLGHHHFWHFYQCCLISDDISSENVIRWHVDQQWHVCCLGMTSFWPEMTAFWGKNGWFLNNVLPFLAIFWQNFSTSSRPKMLSGMSCWQHVVGNAVSSHLGQKCHPECHRRQHLLSDDMLSHLNDIPDNRCITGSNDPLLFSSTWSCTRTSWLDLKPYLNLYLY